MHLLSYFGDGGPYSTMRGTTVPASHGRALKHSQLSGAMLKDFVGSAEFWSGEAWTMWVADEPNGKGKTILSWSSGRYRPPASPTMRTD
jgi:hypothetical protein